MPLHAKISARDVGGVLKGETATGAAMAHARVRIELTPDWRTRGKARITYGWTKAPGIDFLGRRIIFTDQADEKLKRSEEHTSELQSLMRISYAVFCLKKKYN